MSRQTATLTARILGIVGVLFMLAMTFDILPRNIALFLGVACFVIAGGLWGMGGSMQR